MKNFGVTTPVAGAGAALALGLLLGAAMRPQLAIGELAPQPLDAWPQEPSLYDGGAPDALAFAKYGGELPDYVLGADWLAATAPAETPPAPDAAEPASQASEGPAAPQEPEAAPDAAAHATPTAAQAAAPATRPQPASQEQAANGEAGAPPAIPTLAIEDNAPLPEATGDTSLAH